MANSHSAVRIPGYEEVIARAIRCLTESGLQVVRSFDYRSTRPAKEGIPCTCPFHGTTYCDCQMVVLLVYGTKDVPVTLIMHGCDHQTGLSIVDTTWTSVNRELGALIQSSLAQAHIPFVST